MIPHFTALMLSCLTYDVCLVAVWTRILLLLQSSSPTSPVRLNGWEPQAEKPKLSRSREIRCGYTPRSVKHALQLDEESGTTFWMDTIEKEIGSLLALN